MNTIDTLNKKLYSLKERAKRLTTEIAAIQDSAIATKLHTTALDVLLGIVDIKKDIEQLTQKNSLKPKPILPDQTQQNISASGRKTTAHSNSLSQQDKINQEIKKVHRKLPRWAKNQDQINAQILIKFLKLQHDNQSNRISESELKEAYGNDYEFFRNFNQMKTVAPKNHAKVFEVKHGLIEIWPPIRDAVEKFRKTTGNKERQPSAELEKETSTVKQIVRSVK